MTRLTIPPDQVATLCVLHAAGLRRRDAIAASGLLPHLFDKRIVQLGLVWRTPSPQRLAQMRDMHRAGATMREAAVMLDVTVDTIRRWSVREGLSWMPRNRAPSSRERAA